MDQKVDSGLWLVLEKNAQELARLLVPLACVGCAEPDHVLCPQCAAHFFPFPQQTQELAPRLVGSDIVLWACGLYAQPTNFVIMNWKDGRRVDAGPHLQRIMRHGARHIAQELLASAHLPTAVPPSGPTPPTPGGATLLGPTPSAAPPPGPGGVAPNIIVVPLPSSARSRRKRGFVPAQELAQGVVEGLQSQLGTRARVALGHGLSVHPRKADQVGLDSRKRAANLAGTLNVSSLLAAQCAGATIIVLVDDLVTTGATMREAMRVLPRQQGTLVTGMTLCVTRGRGKTTRIQNRSGVDCGRSHFAG